VVGATYFWFPKMTGRMMEERLGRWNFWTMFVGFNLGFFPMHISGLLGMPRRIYTYGADMGWNWVNLVTTVGSFLFGIGVLIFVWNVLKSYRHGPSAGDNPWDAPTLEWATTSPPPPYNFAVLPTVASRHPLWEDRLESADRPQRSFVQAGLVLEQGREALATTPLDAEPNLILKMPGDTLVPLWLALSMTIVTAGLALVNWWVVVVGIGFTGASIIAWLWPEARLGETAVPAVGDMTDG
jgi:cytochrome c oxidase subunit 1/cytochrome c oxidase subunit I+III